ncbi:MAG: L-threonylcarbamoyladenylate synthase [Pseudomonadota bacterium]
MPAGHTEVLDAGQAGIARAATLLRAGGCVAFPTETVYGLGANAGSGAAVAGIFEAKGRPRFNPLIVHVPSLSAAQEIGVISGPAQRLAEAFWPGPLTLVVPLREAAGISPLVTSGLDTIGLRVPQSAVAQALLREVGQPIAAPSANPSGRVSPTTAAHVLDGLAGRIAAVLDGGTAEVGLESTIIGFAEAGTVPQLLRPGGLPSEVLEEALGRPLSARPDPARSDRKVIAPGQLSTHYAPRKSLRLEAEAPREGELWLGFGAPAVHPGLTLSASGDLREAAAALFGHLRRLDRMEGIGIAVAPVPEVGLGRAINDRLRRAAAPRR